MKPVKTLTLVLLALVALVGAALPTAAQDVLPVPYAPGDARLNAAAPYAPASGARLNRTTSLVWYNVGADQYTVVFKNLATGFKQNSTTIEAESCGPTYCNWNPTEYGIFQLLQNGATYSWQVVAMKDGDKTKSSSRIVIVDRAVAPTLLSMPDGGYYVPGDIMQWTTDPANTSYQVHIKDKTTGQKVAVVQLDSAMCPFICAINPTSHMSAIAGHEYKWWVKAFGIEMSARSEKRSFSVD
ncbi:MAG: hypothetical protein IPM16_20225 [Chloroflexi bacterium]|nr:hypothetical protein [Chloroflexota bacterium]